MPGRIGEDPPPIRVRLVVRFARAQLQQPGLCLVQVVDREVEVKLLGNSLIGPARSPVPWSSGTHALEAVTHPHGPQAAP